MSTIRDVAKIAGVSISTVSHVVNKTRYVSPELAERVERVIASLDPPPNFIVKKNLAEQSVSARQYVLLIKNGSCSQKLEEALRRLLQAENLSLVTMSYLTQEDQNACRAIARLPGCAGALVLSGGSGVFPPEEVLGADLPRVVIGLDESTRTDRVYANISEGATQGILHLLRSGHEQIAFLDGVCAAENPALAAYQEMLNRFHIPYVPELVHTQLENERAVFSAMDTIFTLPTRPTAIYTAARGLAVPVFRYLEVNNIRCPQDVSVVCFGDFDWSSLHSPSITTVHVNIPQIAAQAVERLLDQLSCRDNKRTWLPKQTTVPTKLILRASTAGITRGPFGEKGCTPDCLQLTASEVDEIHRKHYTAAISFHYTGKAYMDLIVKGMTDVFKSLGINIIATTDAHFDPKLQCRQLESLGLLKPDIVVGIPTDDTLTADSFRIFPESTRLIFMGHVPIGFRPEEYVSCISVDDRAYGQYVAQSLAENMQRLGLHNVGMLMRGGRFFAINQRDAAAEQLLSEQEGIKICGAAYFEGENSAYRATLELMREHPEVEALYVTWEEPAMDAMQALQELGRSDVVLATADLEYESALVLASGGMIKGIAAQRPYEQGRAVALAGAISLLGRKVPTYITTAPTRITSANLLRAWKDIYREDAPAELRAQLREASDYMEPSLE